MHLIAIAWIYVVAMVALAEALAPNGTLLGAFFTLALYGALPLWVVLYIVGTPARKRALRQRERGGWREGEREGERAGAGEAERESEMASAASGEAAQPHDGTAARPAAASDAPDGGGHAAARPVAAERKEP